MTGEVSAIGPLVVGGGKMGRLKGGGALRGGETMDEKEKGRSGEETGGRRFESG